MREETPVNPFEADPEEADEIAFMLAEIENIPGWNKLTRWEREFIESVSDQFGRRGSLSEKQVETLRKIYERVTA